MIILNLLFFLYIIVLILNLNLFKDLIIIIIIIFINKLYKMDYLDIVEKGSDDGWFHQTGNPLVWRSGKQIWIVAPSKSPNLVVYTLPSPQ